MVHTQVYADDDQNTLVNVGEGFVEETVDQDESNNSGNLPMDTILEDEPTENNDDSNFGDEIIASETNESNKNHDETPEQKIDVYSSNEDFEISDEEDLNANGMNESFQFENSNENENAIDQNDAQVHVNVSPDTLTHDIKLDHQHKSSEPEDNPASPSDQNASNTEELLVNPEKPTRIRRNKYALGAIVLLEISSGEIPSCQDLQEGAPREWSRGVFTNCLLVYYDENVAQFEITVKKNRLNRAWRELPEQFLFWMVNRLLNIKNSKCKTILAPIGRQSPSKNLTVVGKHQSSFCLKVEVKQFIRRNAGQCEAIDYEEQLQGVSVVTYRVNMQSAVTNMQIYEALKKRNSYGKICAFNGYIE